MVSRLSHTPKGRERKRDDAATRVCCGRAAARGREGWEFEGRGAGFVGIFFWVEEGGWQNWGGV